MHENQTSPGGIPLSDHDDLTTQPASDAAADSQETRPKTTRSRRKVTPDAAVETPQVAEAPATTAVLDAPVSPDLVDTSADRGDQRGPEFSRRHRNGGRQDRNDRGGRRDR